MYDDDEQKRLEEEEARYELLKQRADDRAEMLDIALSLLTASDPAVRMKATSTLLKWFEDQANDRIFRERHQAQMELMKIEEELRATAKGMLQLARWFAQRRQEIDSKH
jgi:hypothetical protein